MKNVGIIFGGRSVEHEVSVITAMQIIENMDRSKYKPVAIYIDKEGSWLTGDSLLSFEAFKSNKTLDAKRVMLSGVHGDNKLYLHPEDANMFSKKVVVEIDFAFPAIHGTNGEDGTLQGVLELANIPYAGAGVLGSSLGMDKIVMKDVFRANGIPVVDYIWFFRTEYDKNKAGVLERVERELGYPVFVKPSNLGSSIGISKAKDRMGLEKALDIAKNYDKRIIVERAVENPREINCAAMGYSLDIEVSLCEEPLGWEELLSFENKYVQPASKGKSGNNKTREIPADLAQEKRTEIEELAVKAFKILDCRGNARIDFLIDTNGKVIVNEINTLPGSIAFYLWEGRGYSFKDLVDKMILIGEEAFKDKQKNMYSFDADLFNRTQFGTKNLKV